MSTAVSWPDGKRFAFSIFDDPDESTLDNVRGVYALLADLGIRTTKSCWPLRGDAEKGKFSGETCEDPAHCRWLLELQSQGFEIGWHGATWHGASRDMTRAALEKFATVFGHYPKSASNHTGVEEGMYWADARLSGSHKMIYTVLTRGRNWGKYRGHIEGDPHFWGDLCKQYITYYRNFVFQDINTLKACPFMPYHDSRRPHVKYWFASSNGPNVKSYNRCLAEANQDRLEEEGGACIMYTHFARGFWTGNRPEPRFESLMRRLAERNGWFVPVSTLLDHLIAVGGRREITGDQRRWIERKWLLEKLIVGSN